MNVHFLLKFNIYGYHVWNIKIENKYKSTLFI